MLAPAEGLHGRPRLTSHGFCTVFGFCYLLVWGYSADLSMVPRLRRGRLAGRALKPPFISCAVKRNCKRDLRTLCEENAAAVHTAGECSAVRRRILARTEVGTSSMLAVGTAERCSSPRLAPASQVPSPPRARGDPVTREAWECLARQRERESHTQSPRWGLAGGLRPPLE